jgi:hypothetical protein
MLEVHQPSLSEAIFSPPLLMEANEHLKKSKQHPKISYGPMAMTELVLL